MALIVSEFRFSAMSHVTLNVWEVKNSASEFSELQQGRSIVWSSNTILDARIWFLTWADGKPKRASFSTSKVTKIGLWICMAKCIRKHFFCLKKGTLFCVERQIFWCYTFLIFKSRKSGSLMIFFYTKTTVWIDYVERKIPMWNYRGETGEHENWIMSSSNQIFEICRGLVCKSFLINLITNKQRCLDK